jgi:hypothetical protein
MADLAPLLDGCPVPSWVDLFAGGYCEAITHLRQWVLESQGQSQGPRFSKEDFSFLWHLLRSQSWSIAHHEAAALVVELNQLGEAQTPLFQTDVLNEILSRHPELRKKYDGVIELFSTAARMIHAQVISDFPRFPAAGLRDSNSLETLHQKWGLYFRIVLLARVPLDPPTALTYHQ